MTRERFNRRSTLLIAAAFGWACLTGLGQGTVILSDDFETDSSANWSVFEGSGTGAPDYTTEFNHDYSAEGIPPAPNTTAETTRGLKFTVNNNDEVADPAAVTAYPNDSTQYAGNYGIRFDLWLNYNGPAFGGTGSTEFATFGLNHLGDRVSWANSAASDGIWFAVAGEGGASRDYRAYEGVLELLEAEAGFFDRDEDGVFEYEANAAQAPTFPLKTFFPSPDFETPGAPGKRWVEVEVRLVNDEITWVMNGYVISRRFNVSGYFIGSPMIGYMDVFSSIASPREENFVIYDNFQLLDYSAGTLPTELTVMPSDPQGTEPGEDTAAFTIVRAGGTAQALTVPYTVGGTATPGVDYEALPGTVEIPAGANSVIVTVTPLDDREGELDETVTLTLGNAPGAYEVGPLFRAGVVILDDGDTTSASIAVVDGQTYERMPDDELVFRVTREGSTDADMNINLTYGGTATSDSDYGTAMRSVTIPAGEQSVDLILIPTDDSEAEGEETIEVSVVAGTGYAVGDPATATAILRDDDVPPETVLFSDNFDGDTSAQWQFQFGAGNGTQDYAAEFAYDYSWDGIPPAPGSVSSTGLRLRVNKFDAEASAAGVNAYPKGKTFSGNFALRYRLFLSYDTSAAGTTEHSIAGINHSGDLVNRYNTAGGDGLWFAIETDGSASGGRSYVSFVGNPADVPAFDALPAGDFRAFFTVPPFQAVGAPSGQWADVEIAQIGSTVTLTVNGVKIFERDNASAFTSGNVMVGHMDTYNSIGSELGNYTLIDNLRVVQLEGPTEIPIDSILLVDGKVVIAWTGAARLQGADSVSGPWNDVVGATSPYETSPDGPAKFYRLSQ